MKKKAKKPIGWIAYYDNRNILNELSDDLVDLSLDENLRRDILSGKRKRKLFNGHYLKWIYFDSDIF